MSADWLWVGGVDLPTLPPDWPVALDTESSGLFVDGDPGTETKTGAPPARVSVVSVAFRQPLADGTPGEIVKYAWPFDQGPVPGKPGRVRKPSQGGGAPDLTDEDCDAILAKYQVPTGVFKERRVRGELRQVEVTRAMTADQACPNLGLDHWIRLMRWLRDRKYLILANAKHDMHILAAGPRDDLVRQQWRHNKAFGDELSHQARQVIEPLAWTDEDLGPYFGLRLDETAPELGIWDTMLVQGLLDPLESTALKTTFRRLFGQDSAQAEKHLAEARRKLGVGLTKRYDLVPWPLIKQYAADDAEMALLLWEHQQGCIRVGAVPPHTEEQIAKDQRLMRVLYRMERPGVQYDARTSLKVASLLQEHMAKIAATLPFDPSKTQQVGRFYFGASAEGGMGLIPLKTTEVRGDPCVDEAQIRILVQEGRPHAEAYDEYSHCSSAVSKWYRGWAMATGRDGRLRTSFVQIAQDDDSGRGKRGGAVSGRLAVGHIQLHAIPHTNQLPELAKQHGPVRGLIGARPGYELYEMDLPQGEVRIATVVVNCGAMWDVVDSGEDLHGANAKRIWQVAEDDPTYSDLRNVGKRITFGTLYGAGIETLRRQILEYTGLEYSAVQTKDARDAFFAAFPEFLHVPRQIQRKADRGLGGCGYVSLIDGRRRVFGPAEHTHKAFNAVIQGDLAQSAKTWMIEVDRELPGIMLLQIHDSLVVEVKADESGRQQARDAARIGTEVFERDYGIRGRKMPFPIVPELWKADK